MADSALVLIFDPLASALSATDGGTRRLGTFDWLVTEREAHVALEVTVHNSN